MQIYGPNFINSLTTAREDGIAPVWFFWVEPRNRDTGETVGVGLWSGDDDISVAVMLPDGTTETRTYQGGVGLGVEGLQQVLDMTDNPVTVMMSQIAGVAQQIVREYDARLAYCEIHVSSMNGGVLVATPQLEWVGIVDEGPIATPESGGEGGITLTVRDRIIWDLAATSPAKSSDEHQRRRLATDRFCEYAGTIAARGDD